MEKKVDYLTEHLWLELSSSCSGTLSRIDFHR